MEYMTLLRVLFAALLCVPVFLLGLHLVEKLIDTGLKGKRR